MNNNSWGKHFWYVIHNVTMSFPNNPTEEQKYSITQLLTHLGYWLPCSRCRKHFIDFIQENPIDATNKITLLTWVNKLKANADNDKQKQINKSINKANNVSNNTSFNIKTTYF